MRECECGKRFEGELVLITEDGITERSVICSECGTNNIIDYYDEDLNKLIDLINTRARWLKSLNKNLEEDTILANYKKRVNNLSLHLLKVAKKRSKGKLCFVHTAEEILSESELAK